MYLACDRQAEYRDGATANDRYSCAGRNLYMYLVCAGLLRYRTDVPAARRHRRCPAAHSRLHEHLVAVSAGVRADVGLPRFDARKR